MKYKTAEEIQKGDVVARGGVAVKVAKKHGHRRTNEDFTRYKFTLANGDEVKARQHFRLPVITG